MTAQGRRARRFVLILLGAAAFVGLAADQGSAHWADLATAEIAVDETTVEITLAVPTGLLGMADDDRDGRLSSAEVRYHQTALAALLSERIGLTDGTQPGAVRVEPLETPVLPSHANITPRTHSILRLRYAWPQPIRHLTIRYSLFPRDAPAASCLATILHAGTVRGVVFTPEHPEVSVTLDRRFAWAQVGSFLLLGIEHILTGYDHLLFLLGLLVAGGGLPGLVKVVSAFTVAHSITLSLAVLDMVSVPARWVESGIALSIVFVAAENLRRHGQAARGRWWIAFAFGLVHGLGFASVLRDLAIPRPALALSLVSFNLGVEGGQLLAVILASAVLQAMSRWPYRALVTRLMSAGTAGIGLVWLIERIGLW